MSRPNAYMLGYREIHGHSTYTEVEETYKDLLIKLLMDAEAGKALGSTQRIPREQFIRHLRRITQYPYENIKK